MSGTLTNLGDEATYTFTGSSGQTIYFNSLESTTYIYADLTEPERQSNLRLLPALRQPGPLSR